MSEIKSEVDVIKKNISVKTERLKYNLSESKKCRYTPIYVHIFATAHAAISY